MASYFFKAMHGFRNFSMGYSFGKKITCEKNLGYISMAGRLGLFVQWPMKLHLPKVLKMEPLFGVDDHDAYTPSLTPGIHFIIFLNGKKFDLLKAV